MIFANRESSIDHLAEFGRGLMETCEDAPLQGAGLWGAEVCDNCDTAVLFKENASSGEEELIVPCLFSK